MNTPPNSCPSASSSSLDTLSSSEMATDCLPHKRYAMPPTPPFQGIEVSPPELDGKHAFFIGPPHMDDGLLHECHTVLEEEEDTESSDIPEPMTPTSDSHSGVFGMDTFSVSSGITKKPIIVNTPATPPSQLPTAKNDDLKTPSIHRRSSSRLTNLFRRGSTSHDGEPIPPLSPTKRVSHFFSRSNSTKNNSPPSSRSPSAPSDTEETPTLRRPLSQRDSSAGTSPPRSSLFSRSRRSASATAIPALASVHNDITHPAPSGMGSKSRKLSVVAHGMNVPVIPLSSKYTAHGGHVPFQGKLVGEGATAVVKLVHLNSGPTSNVFAVKEFRKRGTKESKESYEDKVNSEYCISKSLNHPNIVMTVDLCLNKESRWCHVMEFCSGGDLCTLIQKDYMKDTEKFCCFKQLVRGVAYLHSHGIAHRDIKPENLLMSVDGHLKSPILVYQRCSVGTTLVLLASSVVRTWVR